MMLQINDSGSWRNVIRFNPADAGKVEEHAGCLAVCGQPTGLRIVDDGIVVSYCMKADNYVWELA